LRNIVERAALLTDGDWIDLQHLPEIVLLEPGASVMPGPRPAQPVASVLENAEREAIRAALRQHTGNRRELAARLGLSERTLYRKLRELDPS
jgi:two-component system, NtrC family, response regulator HydG